MVAVLRDWWHRARRQAGPTAPRPLFLKVG